MGRHDVDAIVFDLHSIGSDMHGEIGETSYDLVQKAFTIGTEMGDDDEREPGLSRQAAKKALQRFDAAGRGPDADDWKMFAVIHSLGLRNLPADISSSVAASPWAVKLF
jgi:hypothetical protein